MSLKWLVKVIKTSISINELLTFRFLRKALYHLQRRGLVEYPQY